MSGATRLRDFIVEMTRLAESGPDEATWLREGQAMLAGLVAQDDWLPEECAVDGPTYRQFLLHCDPLERFSVVSFVWGPGQRTPVHDHTVWGLVGMLRGAENATIYAPAVPGAPLQAVGRERLEPGQVATVSPNAHDIHVVENALADRPSISIHVYGGNIGAVRRHTFDPVTGAPKSFISGYSSGTVPNIWDRSKEATAA
jgi:predicted metal-dependent enzyme (double-stranded beta helix superfamily)